ncbi:MAG: hypothetical protein B6U87_01190 [Candidatus Aenigmarchaeota archaeon ex4484_52]|nr:MAG: hypothetical protein B6U87_01190 [Candidatus Aenigmarchaeota archaeon ex4484_52]
MNNLEIAEKENLIISGHRMCAGCGTPIIVNTILSVAGKNTIVCVATGCLEIASTVYPTSAWKIPYIHNAFENASATISGVESAYQFLKKKNKISKEINFIVFGGDGASYDIGLQSLSGALERRHKFLYVCYDNEGYMNCLSTSSLVMTKNGLKKITQIKKHDEIYAFDQKTHNLVLKKCEGVFDNGIKEVFNLKTLHHSIKATKNHPFLILKRNGRGKTNTFIWKTLGKIKENDEIIVLKNLDDGVSFEFNFKKTKKIDCKVNCINEINLPKKSSPDLMKYLGFFVGDGWVRNKRGEIGFTLPKNTKARNILIKIHNKIFSNNKMRIDNIYMTITSVNLARFIESLGFGVSAKDKTIPSWVFTLPKKEKEAFIDGLILSSGYKIRNSNRYVSASLNLLVRLRLLLQTINMRVGKIHWQKKNKETIVVGRELLKDPVYGYICFSKKKKYNIKKYPSQYRYQNFLIENNFFEIEKVKNINLVGREPTLDLRVEEEHNFIADGIVVHNTGAQRSSATPLGAATTTTPAGSVKQGKEIIRKNLTEIAAAHRIEYIAQASIFNLMDLTNKTKKALNCKGPSVIIVLQPCPTNWGFPTDKTIKIAKLASNTCFWPLYEIENRKYNITYKPAIKKPIEEYLKVQKRFAHLLKQENKSIIEKIQKDIDEEWKILNERQNIF